MFAVWCRVLQCVAVCCSELQCVAVCCSEAEPKLIAPLGSPLCYSVAMCCHVLQCVAVCCHVLQCVAMRCHVLQCVAVCCSVLCKFCAFLGYYVPQKKTAEKEDRKSKRFQNTQKTPETRNISKSGSRIEHVFT